MSLRYLDSDEPLRRYIEIKAEIAALEEELEQLKPLLTAALWEEPEHHTTFMGFEMYLQRRRTFQYSEELQALEQQVKAMKREEEANGVALLVKEISFPACRALKEDVPT